MKPALEYDIFVPLVQASGQRHAEAKTKEIQADIAEFFGGITDTHHVHEGWWKVGGMMIRDELVIWRVLSEKGPDGDLFIKRIKARLEKALEQDVILVVRRQVDTLG
jgi:NADPH-dependent 2,4-dienoyl-CoA reductase/sulfur reductase-like enzyme